MRKYYAAVNSIISDTKNVNDILKLNLLETCTLPNLKYACESLLFNHNTLFSTSLHNEQMRVYKNCSILLWSSGFHPYSSFRKIEVHCPRGPVANVTGMVMLRRLGEGVLCYLSVSNTINILYCYVWIPGKHEPI